MTNEIIDNYYDELAKVRIELIKRIKNIVKEDVIIYDITDGDNEEYYELPLFDNVNKYNQHDIYSIIKITKDLNVIGNSWESGDNYNKDITELSLDSLYDLYLELTK